MFEREFEKRIEENLKKEVNENEMEFVKIEVGEEFPLYKGSVEKILGTEGVRFEASDSNQGYLHIVYYPGITKQEIEELTKLTVKVRVLESEQGFVLILFKYGNTPMIHELSFDPTIYSDARALQLAGKNNIVTTYCVDSNTNILKGIRQANLPLKMIQKCREMWSKAFLVFNYSEQYTRWYWELQQNYLPEQLWSMGVDVGELGETYNLDEIHYSYKDDEQ